MPALATPVDEFLFHNTFIPWKIEPRSKNKLTDIAHLQPNKDRNGILRFHVVKELQHWFKAQGANAPSRVSPTDPTASTSLINRVADFLMRRPKAVVPPANLVIPPDLLANRMAFEQAMQNHPLSMQAAVSPEDSFRRAYLQFAVQHQFDPTAIMENAEKYAALREQIRLRQGNAYIAQPLGYMFFERVRIRALGYTVERAPFFELTLTPHEIVTLRHRSFSRRLTSLEETAEEAAEQKVEFSSTFSTEFSKEFERVVEKTTSWGIQQSMSASVQVGIVELKGQTDGSYTQTDQSRTSTRELSRVMEQVARKVESTQKAMHKTVMTVSSETSIEQEATRVLRNDDAMPRKWMFRKVMQALHASHERFDVRACWVAAIADPASELRALVITEERFPDEWAKARAKWQNAEPPEDVGYIRPNVSDTLPGGIYGSNPIGAGDSGDDRHTYTVPSGYELKTIDITVRGDGWAKVFKGGWRCPHGATYPYPGAGATGDITYHVHYGVGGFGSGEYRITITSQPPASERQEVQAKIDAWRKAQIEAEVMRLLTPRYEEIIASIPDRWPPMIVMRRIVKEYFGLTTDFAKVDVLHRLFDWDRMSIVYYPPAYDPNEEPRASQFIPTDFFNASWAKVIIPLRPENEQEALGLLFVSGIVPSTQSFVDEVQFFMAQMNSVLRPLYQRGDFSTPADLAAVQSPLDIRLTTLGSAVWANDFERPQGFEVLDRYVVTIPTDGVDIEEGRLICDYDNPFAERERRVMEDKAQMTHAIRTRVAGGDGEITVKINAAN